MSVAVVALRMSKQTTLTVHTPLYRLPSRVHSKSHSQRGRIADADEIATYVTVGGQQTSQLRLRNIERTDERDAALAIDYKSSRGESALGWHPGMHKYFRASFGKRKLHVMSPVVCDVVARS
jgi:hypothetical protein